MAKRRQLTADEVEFVLLCEPEDIPIEGNCSAIDEETDRATAEWIYDQLDRGNEWAWCCAHVIARWEGFEGHDYLGCCSYEGAASFRQPGGYYDDMKAIALDELNRKVAEAGEALDLLEGVA